MSALRLTVPGRLAGERADKVVAELTGESRSTVRRAFDAGAVTVGGEAIKPKDRLSEDVAVEVDTTFAPPPIEADASVPFEVLLERDDYLVIDKPIGVVVHPTSPRSSGTLVHGLIDRFPEIRGVGQDGRWGIVHRLDRDTSGLMVVARTHNGYEAFSEMMRGRQVGREYLALAAGLFGAATGTIDAPIARDPKHANRMALDRAGRRAVTHYRRLAAWELHDATLLSVRLETGRTHQIRVHLKSIDHPVIGDRTYGRPRSVGDPRRPWLHARRLTFVDPFIAEEVEVVSALPDDLATTLRDLGEPDVGEVDIDELGSGGGDHA